jgi:small-conductance mechanosensitive channel
MRKALRPIGLALLAVAIVGAILVPARTDGWNASAPLAHNLREAAVIARYELAPGRMYHVRTVVVSAGDAFAALAALALLGVGLMVFTPHAPRP